MTTFADCVTVTRRDEGRPKGTFWAAALPERRGALPPEGRVTANQGEIERGGQQLVTRDLAQRSLRAAALALRPFWARSAPLAGV
jgi:hypothetical protein